MPAPVSFLLASSSDDIVALAANAAPPTNPAAPPVTAPAIADVPTPARDAVAEIKDVANDADAAATPAPTVTGITRPAKRTVLVQALLIRLASVFELDAGSRASRLDTNRGVLWGFVEWIEFKGLLRLMSGTISRCSKYQHSSVLLRGRTRPCNPSRSISLIGPRQ